MLLGNYPTAARSTFLAKNATGFYPRVQLDASRVAAVGQAGGVLLADMLGIAGWTPP